MRKTTEKWTVERTEEIDPQLIKEQIDKELPEKIKPLEDRVEVLEKKAPTDLSEFESRLTAVEAEDKKLRADINRVETKVNSTETQIAATKKNSDKNTADLIKANQKIASLESKNTITDAKIKNLENRATSIEGKVTRIEESEAKEKTRLDKVESNIKDMLIELDRLRQQQGGTAPEPEGVKAFPTAYGSGANASGGRGGTVSVVTNLNDSGTGSLRSFANTSNTTIIFDVSGVINLSSVMFFTGSNVTIAGQTAPEGGITIAGDVIIFQGNKNFICRYLRFRGGFPTSNKDGVSGYYWENAIFDHCSVSFGTDEAMDISVDTVAEFGGNVTIQNCFFAESKTGVYTGGDVAADQFGDFSFFRNVFYNISHRVPNIASNSRYDIINNYSHNIYWRLTRGNGSYEINQIGNVFDYGNNPITNDRMNLHGCEVRYTLPTIYTDNNLFIGTLGNQSTHPLDNTIAEINADNKLSWKYFYDDDVCGFGMKTRGDQLEPIFFTNTMYPLMGIAPTVLTRENVESTIVPNAGASKRLNADGTVSSNVDVLDSEWRNNIINKIYVAYGDRYTWSVPAISSVNRPGGFYGVNQYIPQAFLTAKGVTNTLTVHNELAPSGYTWLEEYLNQVDN